MCGATARNQGTKVWGKTTLIAKAASTQSLIVPHGDNPAPHEAVRPALTPGHARSVDHLPRIAAGLRPARRDRTRAGRAPGHRRLRRDGLWQDHAAAEDRADDGPRARRGR